MGLFDLKLGKLKLPLYDIGTLAAGFYTGYNEGKGINVSATVEYLTKYGPTAFAITTTPIIIKLINIFWKLWDRTVAQGLRDGNLEVNLQNGSTKEYELLNKDERQEVVKGIKNLESKLQNPEYLKPTAIIGARTAIESTLAYIAGRLCSQIK